MSHAFQRNFNFLFPRFAYVDVAVGSVMRRAIEEDLLRLLFSYDSACGHGVNFFKRLADYDPPLITRQTLEEIEFQELIPKFHLAGHKPECADKYSFNYTKNVG